MDYYDLDTVLEYFFFFFFFKRNSQEKSSESSVIWSEHSQNTILMNYPSQGIALHGLSSVLFAFLC